ncbi:oligopeptide/dipeptide ABC transporter, ATPase subunit [Thermaerobacter marianensis DSM 12885]|uniref:Oligopeptide/dipeptide ABC transporter, ATPase subunit n=1 Tax=Thermaerobacter marianensis (strain ATCC 700841 / DSM 12885 / JCM 10246 / 7p75a) TaxID=644966 RepID=E6SMG1_THEM7|nr:dipeptide ABC transporter ATP-binding protein [Thermaerobacter marianensis]ADU50421.1 oligopeptide/dipeptide ABC transporter, ATPase subunit [Thermaerobacter marianensis DSM 12885]
MAVAEPRVRTAEPLVKVEGLKKYFPITRGLLSRTVGYVRAVDGVSLEIHPGETFGLVGESGCGKSTLARLVLRLIPATEGRVWFDGQDLFALPPAAMRKMRRQMQIIFQDPFGSLNPRFTVADIIGEPLRVHGMRRRADRDRRVAELMEMVGLNPAWRHRFPHQFSGGQRQRIGIARAIALNPRFVVADEAVSSLDVSVQAQILNLLADLQERLGLTYLFIAHGLNVVRHVSTRVGVMYLGQLVEVAPVDELFSHPAHPYTAALLSAVPVPHPRRRRERIVLQGDVPSPANPPAGCRFHPRCPFAQPRCREERPVLRTLTSGHAVACHFPLE